MTKFKLTKGMIKAGWIFGVGDTLRAARQSIAVLMLNPNHGGQDIVRGLIRIRVGSRVTCLEYRLHDTPTGRCSRGRWFRLAACETPQNARQWLKLVRMWRWRAHQISTGKIPDYFWTDDIGKDPNRCYTRVNANAWGPRTGRGAPKRCKEIPSMLTILGYVPKAK